MALRVSSETSSETSVATGLLVPTRFVDDGLNSAVVSLDVSANLCGRRTANDELRNVAHFLVPGVDDQNGPCEGWPRCWHFCKRVSCTACGWGYRCAPSRPTFRIIESE